MVNVVDLSDLSPSVLILNTHVVNVSLFICTLFCMHFSSLGGFYN